MNCIVIIAIFQLFWTWCLAIPTNDVNSRYFIGEYNADEFPFAMNKCQASSIFGGFYYTFECINITAVKQTNYLDNECTSQSGDPEIYTVDDITGDHYGGGTHDFNCDEDATNAYVGMALTISTCDANPDFEIVYAAVNVCVQVPDLTRTLNTYCSDSYDGETIGDNFVQLQYYDYGSTCGVQNYTFNRTGVADCGYILTTSATNTDVYGYVVECKRCGSDCLAANDTSGTNNDTNSNSDSDTDTESDIGYSVQGLSFCSLLLVLIFNITIKLF